MNVWARVVEDLQKQTQPVVEKTFLQKVWNIMFSKGCAGDGCHQGRNPGGCNCGN